MTLKIIHKNNTSTGQAPAPSDLDIGEIAINSADAKLYIEDNDGTIQSFTNDSDVLTTVEFTQSGTSVVARNLESKLKDILSVKDFGAVGDGATDDTTAIQAAIDSCKANSVKTLFFPSGNYRLSSQLTVSAPLALVGNPVGTNFYSVHAGNCLVFQPDNVGASNTYLPGGGVYNITVTRIAAAKGGSAIWLRQCNGFLLVNVGGNNHDFGFRISGGQLNRLVSCRSLCSSPYTGETVNSSAGLFLEQADIGGGNYQPCYTVTVSDWYCSSNRLQRHAILINSVDGFSLVNAYMAYYTDSHIRFARQRFSDQITAVQFTNSYFDAVDDSDGTVEGTPYAVRSVNNLGGTEQGARAVKFNNCFFGNNDGDNNQLIYVQKYIDQMIVNGCTFGKCSGSAILLSDNSAGASYGSYVFSNNTFNNTNRINTGAGAINAQNTRRLIITGNEFNDVSDYCVVLVGTNAGVIITDNTKQSSAQLLANLGTATELTINNLGDNAEGAFTPVLTIGGTNVSSSGHTAQEGYYVKTGSAVNIHCKVSISSKETLTGELRIDGLPFDAKYSQTLDVRPVNTNLASSGIYADTIGTTNNVRLLKGSTTSSSTAPMLDSDIFNTASFFVSGFYLTD